MDGRAGGGFSGTVKKTMHAPKDSRGNSSSHRKKRQGQDGQMVSE